MQIAEGAEARAEAEARDALMKLDAMAAGLQTLEKIKEPASEKEVLLKLRDFASGEFVPASGHGRVFAEPVEEELDFGEREVHFAGEADE
jgi:hypothetical protein